MTQYQVVGECAHVTVDSAAGRVSVLLYRPSPIPPGVPQERIDHLLSVGLIAKIGSGETIEYPAPLAPDAPPAEVDELDPEVLKARDAAQAKLPTDGSAPHANAGKDVWVEYAVAKGMDRTEADKADKADLIAALKP